MNDSNLVEAVVEIPSGSAIKYEWDRQRRQMMVDRILRDGFKYPCAYGYILDTLDYDGDELDVLIYALEPITNGVMVRLRIIGALKMIDEGETDTKLIGVHADDYRLTSINTIDDLPEDISQQIVYFFSNYKNWKGVGSTQTDGYESAQWALSEVAECRRLYKEYHTLTKSEFITEMRALYPEKFTE